MVSIKPISNDTLCLSQISWSFCKGECTNVAVLTFLKTGMLLHSFVTLAHTGQGRCCGRCVPALSQKLLAPSSLQGPQRGVPRQQPRAG